VKFRFQEYRRLGIIPVTVLALGAYYLFVFLPLGRRAESLNAPLQRAWQSLTNALDQTNAVAIDFQRITNQLSETHQALAILETAKSQASARLQLPAPVRARMTGPFQLVEYQDERSKELDELSLLAKQHNAAIDPAVFANFPEHTADVKQPTLLWGALAFVDGLLRTAIQCNVGAIHSLEAPLAITNAPPTSTLERLAEIPLQVEFTSTVASATKLIQSLPLRAEEIRSAGLPEAPADKPVLFIDRLIITKQSPEKPDEVHVSLRAVGFVLRE
jgi:hypothetical protein